MGHWPYRQMDGNGLNRLGGRLAGVLGGVGIDVTMGGAVNGREDYAATWTTLK